MDVRTLQATLSSLYYIKQRNTEDISTPETVFLQRVAECQALGDTARAAYWQAKAAKASSNNWAPEIDFLKVIEQRIHDCEVQLGDKG